jgi:hypothetical protein
MSVPTVLQTHLDTLAGGGAVSVNSRIGTTLAGNASPSICPAGGLRDHQGSFNYMLAYGGGSLQNNLRWCKNCQGPYYAGLGAGTGRGRRSGYSLVHDLANAAGQAACKWCAQCYALAFKGG